MSSIAKPPLFNYYDIVKLVNVDGDLEEIDRNFGIVLGMSQDSEFRWWYSVDVYSDASCKNRVDGWSVSEINLAATGRRVSDSFIYGGESIKLPPDIDPT
jgi:hypothetical protein